MASSARVRASGDRTDCLYGTLRWKWLTTTITDNLLGDLSTKASRLEWAKKKIFMLSRPHWSCARPPETLCRRVLEGPWAPLGTSCWRDPAEWACGHHVRKSWPRGSWWNPFPSFGGSGLLCHSATSPIGGWCLGPPAPWGETCPPPCTEGAHADVRLGETDRRAFCSDDGSDGGRDVVPSDLLPLGVFLVTWERHLAGVAFAS